MELVHDYLPDVGTAAFAQVFEPPADFVPWELDESLLFADLPAGECEPEVSGGPVGGYRLGGPFWTPQLER